MTITPNLALRFLRGVWPYLKAWALLPFTVQEMEKKLKGAAVSPDAKYCPNCDRRMTVDHSSRDYWSWRCESCEDFFSYNR